MNNHDAVSIVGITPTIKKTVINAELSNKKYRASIMRSFGSPALIGFYRILLILFMSALAGCSSTDNQSQMQASGEIRREHSQNVCYESSYAGYRANQHIQRHEYVSLSIKDTVIEGKGAGEAEGNPSWTFTCIGRIVNDSVFKLQVSYKIEGADTFMLNEEWRLNKSSDKISIVDPSSKRPGTNAYDKIECADLPAFYVNLFSKLN